VCFFGGDGCNYVPGLRGVIFIAMYVVSYVGGGLLLRYAEGATYLAVVQVRASLTLRPLHVPNPQNLRNFFSWEKRHTGFRGSTRSHDKCVTIMSFTWHGFLSQKMDQQTCVQGSGTTGGCQAILLHFQYSCKLCYEATSS